MQLEHVFRPHKYHLYNTTEHLKINILNDFTYLATKTEKQMAIYVYKRENNTRFMRKQLILCISPLTLTLFKNNAKVIIIDTDNYI